MVVRDIHRGARPEPSHEPSLKDLFSDLTDELSTLFRQEVALAKAETTASLATLKAGAIALGIAAVLALGGYFVLLFAAVYGLSALMHQGWAALIVGVVTLIGAAIAGNVGLKKLKARSMVPRRSVASLKRDAEVATRRNHEHG